MSTRHTIPHQKRDDLIEEIEFFTACAVGEATILAALGFARNPETLKRKLARYQRHDLIPRIFEWDATINDRRAMR